MRIYILVIVNKKDIHIIHTYRRSEHMCVVAGDGVDGISEKMLFFQKSVYAIKLAIQKNKIQPLADGTTHTNAHLYFYLYS